MLVYNRFTRGQLFNMWFFILFIFTARETRSSFFIPDEILEENCNEETTRSTERQKRKRSCKLRKRSGKHKLKVNQKPEKKSHRKGRGKSIPKRKTEKKEKREISRKVGVMKWMTSLLSNQSINHLFKIFDSSCLYLCSLATSF